jgi:hypothetical protein
LLTILSTKDVQNRRASHAGAAAAAFSAFRRIAVFLRMGKKTL